MAKMNFALIKIVRVQSRSYQTTRRPCVVAVRRRNTGVSAMRTHQQILVLIQVGAVQLKAVRALLKVEFCGICGGKGIIQKHKRGDLRAHQPRIHNSRQTLFVNETHFFSGREVGTFKSRDYRFPDVMGHLKALGSMARTAFFNWADRLRKSWRT